MGPRPCGHGNLSRIHATPSQPPKLQWGHGLAAMETSPAGKVRRRSIAALQWGHGLAAMETSVFGTSIADCTDLLQWGHGLAAMETGTGLLVQWFQGRFNGATALRPWKRHP